MTRTTSSSSDESKFFFPSLSRLDTTQKNKSDNEKTQLENCIDLDVATQVSNYPLPQSQSITVGVENR